MSVVINAATGLAEDLPDEAAQQGLESGSHLVALNDEQGNPVNVPYSEASGLVSMQGGHTQPSTEQLQSLLNYAKWSSPEEQAKTFAEGAGSAATFGASTLAETLAGVNPEDISGRREVNPGMHMLGGALGLLTPGGAGKVLASAGRTAAVKLGLEASPIAIAAAEKLGFPIVDTFLQKVGSSAVKGAVETALFNTGDEVSKAFAKDEGQTLGTAAVNVGLGGILGGGIIGGALGTVPGLWKLGKESKTGQFLSAIRDKANGLEKPSLPGANIGELADKAGIELSATSRAAVSENPVAREWVQQVGESNSRAGAEIRADALNMRQNTNDAVLKAVGKDEAYLSQLPARSEFEEGKKLVGSVTKSIEDEIRPLSEGFESIKDQYKNRKIGPNTVEAQRAQLGELPGKPSQMANEVRFNKESLANEVADFAQSEGTALTEGSSNTIVKMVLNGIPKLETLQDISNLVTRLNEAQREKTANWFVTSRLKNILINAQDTLAGDLALAEGKITSEELGRLKSGYLTAMEKLRGLDEKIKLGDWSGPKSFSVALNDAISKRPEEILSRLTPKNDATLLNFMSQNFPGVTQTLRDTYLDKVMKAASKNPPAGMKVDPKVIFNAVKEWSPELRDFVLPKGAAESLDAAQQLLKKIPPPGNPPHTARTLDNMWSFAPGGAMAMVSMVMGHNPVVGFVLGQLARHAATEVPNAMKLAALKFLGSPLPVNSAGFKAMADFISHTYKGNGAITNGIKNLFKSGATVLPAHLESNEKKKKVIKDQIHAFNQDPSKMLEIGGELHHYLPGIASELASTAMRAQQYLNSLKPNTDKQAPLDEKRKPSYHEDYKYDRAVSIAAQPLEVLKHIQKGTLTTDDVTTLKTIYPSLYEGLSSKLMMQVIDQSAKGKIIPYSLRTQLSRFLGQPLDSTQTPAFIASMQTPNTPSTNPPGMGQSQKQGTGTMKALQKLPGTYSTQSQQAEARNVRAG